MEDARGILHTVVMNGGTKTFIKPQNPGRLFELLHQLSCQGYLECVGETQHTITYRIPQSPSPSPSVPSAQRPR